MKRTLNETSFYASRSEIDSIDSEVLAMVSLRMDANVKASYWFSFSLAIDHKTAESIARRFSAPQHFPELGTPVFDVPPISRGNQLRDLRENGSLSLQQSDDVSPFRFGSGAVEIIRRY
jgi:hypothetical protein